MIPKLRSAFQQFLIVVVAVAALASCSGGVSGPAPVNDPSRITILPENATVFSGVPTTFVISGGTGSYIVSSSNQAVIPISGPIVGGNLVVTPNAVSVDTPVTLTVRDTGSTPLVNATVTVRPGTIANEITVTASSTQGLSCAPAVCSGGDAEVVATLTQLGLPVAGRAVRFDAVSGEFRFVTSPSGSGAEVLETSATVLTDQTGRARTRIRALANAANQTALLQAMDVSTGAFQRTSFPIAQATGTSPGFTTSPSSITFQGPREGECAGTSISGTIYIFGGTPPYAVNNPISILIVRPDVVTANGGSFTVTPTGGCIGEPGVPITIRDAAGRTVSVNIANITGTVPVTPLAAAPNAINLSSCSASANIQVSGGRGTTYFVASGSDAITATISGSTVTVRRLNPSGPAAATGTIGISDGFTTVNVQLTISGAALGSCPTQAMFVQPTTVTLTDCTNPAQVTATGGSGIYTASSSDPSVGVTVAGNVISIRRTANSPGFTSAAVSVSDGNSRTTITVNSSGAGAGACGTGGSNASLTASPSDVQLTSCSSSPNVVISGATGTLTAISSNAGIRAVPSGNIVSISRVPSTGTVTGSTPCTAPGHAATFTQCVTVGDGQSTVQIGVDPSGSGSC